MDARCQGRSAVRPHYGLLDPLPLREIWPLLNRTHHVDGNAVRLACLLMLVAYVVSSFIRHVPGPAMLAIRLVVITYASLGLLFGSRFGWATLRAYTVGMALLFPVSTAALALLRGNNPADLAVTALAIFAPVLFLQTGFD